MSVSRNVLAVCTAGFLLTLVVLGVVLDVGSADDPSRSATSASIATRSAQPRLAKLEQAARSSG